MLSNMMNAAVCCLLSCVSLCAMESTLRLFSDSDKETNIVLPFAYGTPTPTERQCMKKLDAGCFTVFQNIGENAIVGPMQPTHLMVLSNKTFPFKRSKTIVAHVCYCANFPLLLEQVKDEFKGSDISKTTGIMFTTIYPFYEKKSFGTAKNTFSFKDAYQERTQKEEVAKHKALIISSFGIQDPMQITENIFESSLKDFELGDYEFSELFTFIKQTAEGPIVRSICPMAENIYGNFQYLNLHSRIQTLLHINNASYSKNPYFLQ
jgi:hypothetical protein